MIMNQIIFQSKSKSKAAKPAIYPLDPENLSCSYSAKDAEFGNPGK